MIMAKVEFGYDVNEHTRKMDVDQYLALRAAFPDLGLPEERASYLHIAEAFLDLEEVERLLSFGIKCIVTKIKGLHYPHGVELQAAAAPVQITNVSVPNHALFTCDEVDWLEDACTDLLQERLNDGWRILAVCPSNDARRPDYILGRQKK